MTARNYIDTHGGFVRQQSPAPPGTGEFALTLCITVERLFQMLSVLYEGGAALGYGYLGDHNRDLVNALAWINDNNAPCATRPAVDDVRPVLARLYEMLSDEQCEEDEMPAVTYQKFGGVWYVGFPCGDCGGLEWVALGVGAALDPSTGAPLPASGQPGSAPFPPGGVGSFNINCYKAQATDYLTNRFIQYVNYVTTLTVPAIDALLMEFDEIVDIARVLASITSTGSVAVDIRNFGVYAVEQAVLSSSVQSAMELNWTYAASVTSADLSAWIKASVPTLVNGVPLRAFMDTWLVTLNVTNVNKDLSLLANECENGVDVQPAPAPLQISFVANNADYVLVRRVNPQRVTGTMATKVLSFFPETAQVLGSVGEIVAHSGSFAGCGANNPRWNVRNPDAATTINHSPGNLNNVVTGWQGSVPLDLRDAVTAALGGVAVSYSLNPTTETPGSDIRTTLVCGGATDATWIDYGYIYTLERA